MLPCAQMRSGTDEGVLALKKSVSSVSEPAIPASQMGAGGRGIKG